MPMTEKKRRWNVANNAEYIKAMTQHLPFFTEEILSPAQQYNEYIMTRLRTQDGIDLDQLEIKFGTDKRESLLRSVKPFHLNHHLIMQESFIRLTREGMLFADGIASDLFIE